MASCNLLLLVCSCYFFVFLAHAQSPTRTVPALVPFEPRDLAFCAGTFFLLSDAHTGHIYELDAYGRLRETWLVETEEELVGIACDETRQWLHVATANYQSIFSLVLPSGNPQEGEKWLEIVQRVELQVDTWNVTNQLGGFTWDSVANEFLITRMDSSPLLLAVSEEGALNRVTRVACEDTVSRVAFDDNLNVLWFLSEDTGTLYQTDSSGAILYQQWTLATDHHFRGLSCASSPMSPAVYLMTVPTRDQAVPLIYEFSPAYFVPTPEVSSPRFSAAEQWAIVLGGVFGAIFLLALLLSCIAAFYVGARWKKSDVLVYELDPMVHPDEGFSRDNEEAIDQALLAV